MTKNTKLFEHGSGKAVIVSPAKLAEMKQAATFARVYREDGFATEAEMAEYRKQSGEAEDAPEGKTAQATGEALPAANAGTTGAAATSTPPKPQTAQNGEKKA